MENYFLTVILFKEKRTPSLEGVFFFVVSLMENSTMKATPLEAAVMLEQIIISGNIPFLKGSPGIGKSKMVHALFKKYNLKIIDHRISGSVPEDFSGLPKLTDTKSKFVPFDIFPLESEEVPEGYDGWGLFLDEYNSGSIETMAATYKLILDRMVNQTKLHEKVIIVLAGNLETDKAIVNPLSTAIRSRVVTINVESDYNSWLKTVGIPFNYDSRIVSFLEHNSERLNNFDPELDQESFACERTWEFMNKILTNILPKNSKREKVNSMIKLFAGTIGKDIATEFISFIENYSELISLKEIMNDPENAKIPHDISLKWHTITNLADNVTEDNFDKAAEYISRYPLNYQVLFFRLVMPKKPNLRNHKSFRRSAIRINAYLNNEEFEVE